MNEDTTELYLIRHGESVPNVKPIIGGMRGDAGLTARGREQAQLLEKRLREEKLHADQLYASTLPSACRPRTMWHGHSTFRYSPRMNCTSFGPATPTA